MSRRIRPIILVSLLFPSVLAAAEIRVFVDPDPATLNQSLRVTFEAAGEVDGEPDFSPLTRHFEILGRSHSSKLNMMNGEVTRSTTWTLSLMPLVAGKLTLPGIRFGSDRSPTTPLTVLSASTGSSEKHPDLFMEVSTDVAEVYVQGQIRYTIRIFQATDLASAQLSEPKARAGDVLIERLGEDKTYRTRRRGKLYEVIERNFVMFPQQSGRLVIEPMVLEGQVIARARSLFDPFGQSSVRRLTSEPVTIDVRPIPTDFPGGVWLPARDLDLREVWSDEPDTMAVGEPVTRTLALIVHGLTAGQLPEIRAALPLALKQYPDQPVLSDQHDEAGVVGVRQEKIAIIPAQPGNLELPAIAVPWWNTTTNSLEIARLPAHTVRVVAPDAQRGTTPANAVPDTQPTAPDDSAAALIAPMGTATDTTLWRWLAFLLATAWLVTLMAWRRAVMPKSAPRQQSDHVDLKAIKRCCETGEWTRLKTELLRWGAGRHPATVPRSLTELGNHCCEALREELSLLNSELYGSGNTAFSGERLWQLVQQEDKDHIVPSAGPADPLEPLYRTAG